MPVCSNKRNMDLREYLFKKDISVTAFAKEIGFTRSYINAICKKNKVPGRKLAEVIEKATDGNVTFVKKKTND